MKPVVIIVVKGAAVTALGAKVLFIPVPGARIAGGLLILGGGGLTIWDMIDTGDKVGVYGKEIHNIMKERYEGEKWNEIDKFFK